MNHAGYRDALIDNDLINRLSNYSDHLFQDIDLPNLPSIDPNFLAAIPGYTEYTISPNTIPIPIRTESISFQSNNMNPVPSSNIPINQYKEDGWLSDQFFWLFSTGKGDCTRAGRQISVSLRDAVKHYLCLGFRNNFGELQFPFQNDATFILVILLAIQKLIISQAVTFGFRNDDLNIFSYEALQNNINNPHHRSNLYKKNL